jgi:hypothetical protein
VVGWLLLGALGLVVLYFYALNSAGWQDDSPFNLLLRRSVWLALLLALMWGIMKIQSWGRGAWGWNEQGHAPSTRRFPLSPKGTYPHKGPTGGHVSRTTLIATSYLTLVIFDLFSVNWQTNVYPAPPEAHTVVPAVVQAIRQDAAPGEIFRVYNEYRVFENYGVPYGLEDTWGASPLRLARYDELYRSLRMERVWQLLNVKYVITWRQELYAPSQIIYQEADGEEVTYVHRLEQVTPRAWLVYQAQPAGEDEVLARLDAFDFDPAQFALVPPGVSLSLVPPPAGQAGQVTIVGRTPGRLVLDVNTPSEGLLVLSEIDYPGWRATLDGRSVSILRADDILRGVPVPAGQHRLEFVYRPPTFIWGAVISGMTLMAIIAVGLWFILAQKGSRLDR